MGVAAPPAFWLPAAKVAQAAKPLAIAFTLLTGLLTALGIKDGRLQALLARSPHAALLVILLIGAGVLCGHLATATATEVDAEGNAAPASYAPLWAVVAVVAGLVLAVWAWVPDVGDRGEGKDLWSDLAAAVSESTWAGRILTLVVIASFVYTTFRRRTSLALAALLVGTTAVVLGLYGALKLSISEATAPLTPRVAGKVTTAADGTASLSLDVQLSRLRDEQKLVLIVRAGEVQVGRAVYLGDASGDIAETATFSLASPRDVEVSACVTHSNVRDCDLAADSESEGTGTAIQARTPDFGPVVVLALAAPPVEPVSGSLTRLADDNVQVTLTSVRAGSRVSVQASCGSAVLLRGTLTVTSANQTFPLPTGACTVRTIVLRSAPCPETGCTDAASEVLASLALPPRR